jgi:hypothetical protein
MDASGNVRLGHPPKLCLTQPERQIKENAVYSLPQTPQGIGQVLDAGLRLYRASFRRLLPLVVIASALVVAPNLTVRHMMPDPSAIGAPGAVPTSLPAIVGVLFLVSSLLGLVFYVAIVQRLGAVTQGDAGGLGQSVGVGLRKLPVTLLATILYLLVVTVGTVLLIVPGMIFMMSMSLYVLGIALDGDGPVSSLKHSHRLIWGNWWRTATVLSVIFVIYAVIYLAVGFVGQFADATLAANGMHGGYASAVSDFIATAVTYPLMPSVLIAIYHDLKLRKSGTDLEARIQHAAAA